MNTPLQPHAHNADACAQGAVLHDPGEGPSDPEADLFGLRVDPQRAKIALLQVPFDATASSRRGAALGPQTILQASPQLDLYDNLWGTPYKAGIALLPAASDIPGYNAQAQNLADTLRNTDNPELLAHMNQLCDRVNQRVQQQCEQQLAQGKIVGALGGCHGSMLGHIRAHAAHFANLSILHIDAHADLRCAYEGFVWSHASVMYNVLQHTSVSRLVQLGVRDFCYQEKLRAEQSGGRVVTFYDTHRIEAKSGHTAYSDFFVDVVKQLTDTVYISFDIDGLQPHLCPNTGTPVPGGLDTDDIFLLMRALKHSGKQVVGFDLCEVAPQNFLGQPAGGMADLQAGLWDGNVGARMLYQLCGACLGTQKA